MKYTYRPYPTASGIRCTIYEDGQYFADVLGEHQAKTICFALNAVPMYIGSLTFISQTYHHWSNKNGRKQWEGICRAMSGSAHASISVIEEEASKNE